MKAPVLKLLFYYTKYRLNKLAYVSTQNSDDKYFIKSIYVGIYNSVHL